MPQKLAHRGCLLLAAGAKGPSGAVTAHGPLDGVGRGEAPRSKPNVIDWQSMSGRISFRPSLSQQWTCIVITVTNVCGPFAYVRHSNHTGTEVSRSDAPQRSSLHTNLHPRKALRCEVNNECVRSFDAAPKIKPRSRSSHSICVVCKYQLDHCCNGYC